MEVLKLNRCQSDSSLSSSSHHTSKLQSDSCDSSQLSQPMVAVGPGHMIAGGRQPQKPGLRQESEQGSVAAASADFPAPKPVPSWSAGAEHHEEGRCRPCAWHWREGGCINGVSCQFCHLCREGKLLASMKDRKKTTRQARAAARKENSAASSAPQNGQNSASSAPQRVPIQKGQSPAGSSASQQVALELPANHGQPTQPGPDILGLNSHVSL